MWPWNNQGIASPNLNVKPEHRQYFSGNNLYQPGITGYTDRIMDPGSMWQHQSRAIDNAPYEDTNKYMRLKGEPIIAENWNAGDIFNKDTTLTGYKKWPKGDQWNNKDRYLKSDQYLDTLEPSLSGQNFDKKGFNLPSLALLKGILPKQDPRQIALTDFYGGKKNLRDGQTIQGGLMAGYNPVSGGGLNTLTGGKFGAEPTYGLQKAYDKRMGTIEKTLANKYGLTADQIQGIYAGTFDEENEMNQHTQLIQRLRDLKKAKADEAAMLQGIEGQGGTTITTDTPTGDGGYDANVHGPVNYGVGSGGQQSYDTGQGFGAHATSGGPVSNRTGRGRQDWALGGRIGYNRGRVVNPGGYAGEEEFEEFEDENTLDFMRDQGVPYGEMAEKSPFEMRIDELMDEGMSWQEAYDIASEEFNQLAGGEDSFSEEGIASIV